MKIERIYHASIPADEAYELSTSKEFQERKCRDSGSLSWRVTVSRSETGAVVKTRRRMPTTSFPGMLRKLLPSGVLATETFVWGAPEADGSRTARLTVDIHGAPANLAGTLTIIPNGVGASTVVIDADFKVLIPILGGQIERLAAPIVTAVIDAEEASAKAWAAGDRS
jgi:hypothetical protein